MRKFWNDLKEAQEQRHKNKSLISSPVEQVYYKMWDAEFYMRKNKKNIQEEWIEALVEAMHEKLSYEEINDALKAANKAAELYREPRED